MCEMFLIVNVYFIELYIPRSCFGARIHRLKFAVCPIMPVILLFAVGGGGWWDSACDGRVWRSRSPEGLGTVCWGREF